MMKEEVARATEVLSRGGVIVHPTETFWSIGCDATDEEAVQKIYNLKQSADNRNMQVLIDNENRLPSYVEQVPNVAWDLIDIANKPLTIIYPKGKNLASNLLAGDGSIAIRITSNEFCKQLIFRFRKPIVSAAANISGKNSSTSFDDISKDILSKVDLVVHRDMEGHNAGKKSGIIKLGVNGEVQVIQE